MLIKPRNSGYDPTLVFQWGSEMRWIQGFILWLLLVVPGLKQAMAEESAPVAPIKPVAPLQFLEPSTQVVKDEQLNACVLEALQDANPTVTVGEIIQGCEIKLNPLSNTEYSSTMSQAVEREMMERSAEWNPFVVTAHRENYFLPFTYARSPQQDVYVDTLGIGNTQREEAKIQLSLKIPLNHKDLFIKGDTLHLAFTLKAFWQVYNRKYSVPFRETNYRPEIFYEFPLRQRWFNADTAVAIGFEHESNGSTQPLSRSWNRIFANFYFAREGYLIQFRPWYRLPESKKERPLDPQGDDNPDIEKYLGHFELSGTWKKGTFGHTLMLRNNLRSPNYGAIQVQTSFPLWGRLRGMFQWFSGYGESLIDYNHRIDRIGFGIVLTDTL